MKGTGSVSDTFSAVALTGATPLTVAAFLTAILYVAVEFCVTVGVVVVLVTVIEGMHCAPEGAPGSPLETTEEENTPLEPFVAP